MMKRLLAIACLHLFFFSVNAQQPQKDFPSDSELYALVNKYVHTPVKKTTAANGDVFLQRDMTEYLRATVQQAPEVAPSDKDHGHDHNDEMLRSFLNRAHPSVATMNRYFEAAAQEFRVPVSILKASAQVQSNWAQVSESMYGSWGVMGLIENKFTKQITLAASLLNVPAENIKNDAKTNIRAAAALLAHYQRNRPAATTIEGWFESAKDLTGLWNAEMKHDLGLRIYEVIKNGSKTVSLWGEIIYLEPVDVSLPKTITESATTLDNQRAISGVDYPLAVPNFTTCNFNSRPSGSTIKYYFVHYVATGTYQGAINWFKDCSSSVSAHYVIRNSDGQVSQVVAESSRAWSQGVTEYNDQGIGVEHEVLATNLAMWDSEPMLAAAGQLCRNVSTRRNIPLQRWTVLGEPGIYGHSDVRATDCPNMTPARWANFMARVNSVTVLPPMLYSVESPGTGDAVKVTWKASADAGLVGYRLYYSTNETLTSWALAANETTLTPATTSITLSPSQFLVPPAENVYHFRLTAVVTNGTNPPVESIGSNVYSRSSNTSGPKVLIVDGFDRINGSYTAPTHPFAASYFNALRGNASLQITTVANEKIEDGSISLSNYNAVIWFIGDESSNNVPLSNSEKTAIQTYLNGGGKLFISGAEIAWNHGRSASALADLAFFNNYLKATYVADGATSYSAATGVASTPFAGMAVAFGITYPEESPDAIAANGGSTAVLKYNGVTSHGAVMFKGPFIANAPNGALVYLSFTLETATDATMAAVMEKVLAYFDVPKLATPVAYDDVLSTQTGLVKRLNVLGNDISNGVAFNPATVTLVTGPSNGTATVDATGSITYTSGSGFTGTDSYQYRVQNTNGVLSNIATVNITVSSRTIVNCDPAPPEVDDHTPKRELRGIWISSVSNLDWPNRTQTPAQQQAALRTILDQLVQSNINTVYLQVRPESDALYASSIEPWSHWLTNSQGTAPSPLWDPLSFAIDEAHKRGLELHAWINPFRARQSTPLPLAANHVVNQHPEWILDVPTTPVASKILDPGLPAVRQYITDVVMDITTRYDVDGIHFDDYFYPDVITNQDDASYAANPIPGATTKADWRRANGNIFVAKVYDAIAALNASSGRNVVFGVSPFGIWKSGTPAGISGNSSFANQFYDPIAWLQAGKVDYLAPQLYWRISGAQDYNILSKWWNDQGALYNRPIYPGLALYKMVDANDWAPSEIEAHIAMNRDPSREQIKGQILFRSGQLTSNSKGIATALQGNQFRHKALQPVMAFKDAVCPNAPTSVRRDGDTLRWDAPTPASDGDVARKYVVYQFASIAESMTHMNDAKKIYGVVYSNKIALPAGVTNTYFLVTSLDNNNNESEAGAGIILPITGLDLTVRLSGNTAVVNWRTLTEINTRHFEVERSVDGRNFQYVGTVRAAGNSSAPRTYSSQDFLADEGLYYYRIKAVDRDGKTSYSGVRSVNYRKNNAIIVGPNPFESGFNVSNLHGVKRLDVIDLSGKVVLSRTINNQLNTSVEAGHLPAGSYTLRATKNNGEHTFTKLVKL